MDTTINIIIIVALLVLIYFNDFRPIYIKPGEKIRKYHRFDNKKSAFVSARRAEKRDSGSNSCILWILLLGAFLNLFKK